MDPRCAGGHAEQLARRTALNPALAATAAQEGDVLRACTTTNIVYQPAALAFGAQRPKRAIVVFGADGQVGGGCWGGRGRGRQQPTAAMAANMVPGLPWRAPLHLSAASGAARRDLLIRPPGPDPCKCAGLAADHCGAAERAGGRRARHAGVGAPVAQRRSCGGHGGQHGSQQRERAGIVRQRGSRAADRVMPSIVVQSSLLQFHSLFHSHSLPPKLLALFKPCAGSCMDAARSPRVRGLFVAVGSDRHACSRLIQACYCHPLGCASWR